MGHSRLFTEARRGRVILLDEDDEARATLGANLEQAGYEVAPVATTLGLRKALEARRPNVVVCVLSSRSAHVQIVASLQVVDSVIAGRAPLVLASTHPADQMTGLLRECRAAGYLHRHAEPSTLSKELQRIVGLPRRKFAPEGLIDIGPQASTPQWAVVKVLLIDDSELTLELMQDRLRQAGFDVRIAFSLGEVEAIIPGWSPTLIVADVKMPDMRGDDLCLRLKAAAATRSAMVMLCSGLPDAELAALASRVGADGFASKELGIDHIVSAIETLCRTISNPRVSFG